jgi:hypothetical protein
LTNLVNADDSPQRFMLQQSKPGRGPFRFRLTPFKWTLLMGEMTWSTSKKTLLLAIVCGQDTV